jgi:hypothetical protein
LRRHSEFTAESVDPDSLETDIYRFQGIEVRRFLEEHGSLVDTLQKASAVIKSHFGDGASVQLELSTEPETGYSGVFARIATALKPTDALRILDLFDEDWWYDASGTTEGLLNFGLRYI